MGFHANALSKKNRPTKMNSCQMMRPVPGVSNSIIPYLVINQFFNVV
jgi:hypothetical protein